MALNDLQIAVMRCRRGAKVEEEQNEQSIVEPWTTDGSRRAGRICDDQRRVLWWM